MIFVLLATMEALSISAKPARIMIATTALPMVPVRDAAIVPISGS